ncbi:MAG TPA: AlkA N-terminal domain-containing protein [Acidimicrobiales bacterium]
MTRLQLTPAGGTIAADILLATLGAHAIPGAESHEDARHSRLIATGSGSHSVTVEILSDFIIFECETEDPTEIAELVAAVRGWLDLDTDTNDMAKHFATDPILAPLVNDHSGIRIPSYPDDFEATIMTVIGQQVSLTVGRTFGGRLVAAYGSPGPGGLTTFPTPGRLASTTAKELATTVGLTSARSHTIIACANAFLGGLALPRGQHTPALRKRLLAIPGIGQWTVDFLAVRAMADPDAFTASDLILRRALGGISAHEAATIAESWRPWRAYALNYLWTSTSHPSKRRST